MKRTSHSSVGSRMTTFIVLLTLSAAVTSCHKEEPLVPIDNGGITSTMYHLPITDGSYWIYQQEQTDSDGVITNYGPVDSVYVDGDTVIGAYTYKKIRTVTSTPNTFFAPEPLVFYRDSAGYLVDQSGAFIEHDNFTDTLEYRNYSGVVDAWYFMRHRDSSVTVPAGTFNTIDYEGHLYATIPNYPLPIPRYTHELYADNVGKIAEVTFYLSNPGYIQRRLIRYHIQ